MPKVIVGMSGGVDSSVTAYLLKEKGYEVEGLSFLMWEGKGGTAPACCSRNAMDEASKTAHQLGIACSIIDVRNEFAEKVIKPFVAAYISGLTPNPCVLCNRFIKFPFLLKEAEERGAKFVATGHYARTEPAVSEEQIAKSKVSVIPTDPPSEKGGKEGFESYTYFLKKGIDPKKDQSYVLYVLNQDTLKRLLLPMGNYTKNEVRKIANKLHLSAAERPESQEICFVENRNYLKFLNELSPIAGKPGPIVDLNGRIIGTHKGVCGYTIGQRKRMGISSPKPLYVINIDTKTNTLYAGSREAAQKNEFFVEELNWIIPPASGEFRASAKVRSTMKEQPATIYLETNPPSPPFTKGGMGGLLMNIAKVVFDEPQWAPAPGQSAVFYDGDTVIGGGLIKK